MKHCSRCDRPAVRRGMCNSHYNTHRTRQMAYGRWQPDRVDAGPVRVHVQALRDSGLGFRRIAELSGVRRQTIQQLFSPRRGRSKPSAYVASATARKLLAVPVGEAAPGAHIDQTGTVRRLQALVAIGHSQSSLCTQLGITQSNSTRLFHGHSKVTAATAKRVAELYDRLSMVSGTNQRAIRRAKANGWLPPLAWDDDAIDDPGAPSRTAPYGALGCRSPRCIGSGGNSATATWRSSADSVSAPTHWPASCTATGCRSVASWWQPKPNNATGGRPRHDRRVDPVRRVAR